MLKEILPECLAAALVVVLWMVLLVELHERLGPPTLI